MRISNRREFLQKAAVGSASVAAGLAAAGLIPRRIFAKGSNEFHRIAFRNLGSTGIKVSEVGFGCMNMKDPELVHRTRSTQGRGLPHSERAGGRGQDGSPRSSLGRGLRRLRGGRPSPPHEQARGRGAEGARDTNGDADRR